MVGPQGSQVKKNAQVGHPDSLAPMAFPDDHCASTCPMTGRPGTCHARETDFDGHRLAAHLQTFNKYAKYVEHLENPTIG